MLIESSAQDFIELRVTGYEFEATGLPAGDRDANWLNIAGRVQYGAESWSFTAPCLDTWEALQLLEWLRHVLEENPATLDFTEPNLSFAARADGGPQTTIIVGLRGEAAPPSTPDEDRWTSGRVMALNVSDLALRGAADEWERELTSYPPR